MPNQNSTISIVGWSNGVKCFKYWKEFTLICKQLRKRCTRVSRVNSSQFELNFCDKSWVLGHHFQGRLKGSLVEIGCEVGMFQDSKSEIVFCWYYWAIETHWMGCKGKQIYFISRFSSSFNFFWKDWCNIITASTITLWMVYMDQGRCGASCCVRKANIGSLGGKLKSFTDWRKFEGRGPVADPCVIHFVMFEFTDMF